MKCFFPAPKMEVGWAKTYVGHGLVRKQIFCWKSIEQVENSRKYVSEWTRSHEVVTWSYTNTLASYSPLFFLSLLLWHMTLCCLFSPLGEKAQEKEERGECEKVGIEKWRGSRERRKEITPRLNTFIESIRKNQLLSKSATIQALLMKWMSLKGGPCNTHFFTDNDRIGLWST